MEVYQLRHKSQYIFLCTPYKQTYEHLRWCGQLDYAILFCIINTQLI